MGLKRLADLNKRLAVSIFLACLIVGLITFSSYGFVHLLLVLAIALLAAIGVWEYAQLAYAKDFKPSSFLMILVAVCEVFAFDLAERMPVFRELPIFILVGGVVAFFINHFKKSFNALVLVAVEFFGVCYIAVPLSLLLGILYFPESGRGWLFYLIIVTKVTDIGAYFVGRLWGKRKLAPQLSPKKTIEGAIAGFFCAVLASLVIAGLSEAFSFGLPLSLSKAFCLGMLIGLFAQVGDLAESLLKRDAFVKDSNTLPGLGGVLDMVDSLLFTAPMVYFFLRIS